MPRRNTRVSAAASRPLIVNKSTSNVIPIVTATPVTQTPIVQPITMVPSVSMTTMGGGALVSPQQQVMTSQPLTLVPSHSQHAPTAEVVSITGPMQVPHPGDLDSPPYPSSPVVTNTTVSLPQSALMMQPSLNTAVSMPVTMPVTMSVTMHQPQQVIPVYASDGTGTSLSVSLSGIPPPTLVVNAQQIANAQPVNLPMQQQHQQPPLQQHHHHQPQLEPQQIQPQQEQPPMGEEDDCEEEEEEDHAEEDGDMEDPDDGANEEGAAVEVEEKFVCKECSKIFQSKRDLLHHAYIHKENPKYICPICSKVFPSEPGYKRHVRAHQNRLRKSIPCGICSMVFLHRTDLEEHHRENHLDQKLFRCQVCSTEFSWHDNLKKHMRMHNQSHGVTDADHKCEVCKASFLDNTSLRIHMRSHETADETPAKKFTCKICKKSFQFDFSYEAHMNAHAKTREDEDKPTPKNVSGPIQLVTEYGEEAVMVQQHTHSTSSPSPPNNQRIITEIQFPPVKPRGGISTPTPNYPPATKEMMVQIVKDPDTTTVQMSSPDHPSLALSPQTPYGVSYVPPDGKNVKTLKVEKDKRHKPEFTLVDDRKFVKSPFKGGRMPKPKVNVKKRVTNPVLYDLPMTDDKPFECQYCSMKFRWEVSRRIHEREHDPNYQPPDKTARGRPKSSDIGKDYTYRIVRRRDSDEEEEFEEYEDIKGGQDRPKRRYRKRKVRENQMQAFCQAQVGEDLPQGTTVVKLTRRSDGASVPVPPGLAQQVSLGMSAASQPPQYVVQPMSTSSSSIIGSPTTAATIQPVHIQPANPPPPHTVTATMGDRMMFISAKKEQLNGVEVITLMPQTDGATDDEEEDGRDVTDQHHAASEDALQTGPIEIMPAEGPHTRQQQHMAPQNLPQNSIYAVNSQGGQFRIMNEPGRH